MLPSLDVVAARDDEWVTNAMVSDPQSFASLATDAAPELTRRLAGLVEAIWPATSLRSGVLRDGLNWTIRRPVLVVLFLGPVLDIALDPGRWIDVASSGFALTEQTAWLRRHYSPAVLAGARLLTATDVRTWAEVLDGVPEDADIDDLLGVIATTELVMLEGDEYLLSRIGSRMAAKRRVDLLEQLSAQSTEFAKLLEPELAAAGDMGAASRQLESLASFIGSGGDFDSMEHGWMETIRDPSLLPRLFACIRAALLAPGDGFALSRLCAAARRIGTVAAIELYDELIASSADPRYKFMLSSRDEVLFDLLQTEGQAAAENACRLLGLPVLSQSVD